MMHKDLENQDFPLSNAADTLILMHRDAHFGGSFDIMLNYYAENKKGVHPDIDIERIKELIGMERELKQDLAGVLLSGAEAEKIAHSKSAYKKLRDLYEIKNPKTPHPRLIADLILSENEEEGKAIENIVKEKSSIVPFLIELIRSEDFYDPLFPGYGQAPYLAIQCLGRIGDKRAILTLFESLGEGDYFDDDLAVDALHAIGDPAKAFLLKVLRGRPLNIDNEKAAIALVAFKEDPEVAQAAFEMLSDAEVRKDPALPIYLALACEGLPQEKRADFLKMSEDPSLDKTLRQDMAVVAKSWNRY
jgi:hypothetical protein